MDIDEKDYFWKENANNFFPVVAENIDKELGKYKQEMSNISLFKEQENQEFSGTGGIKSALTAVPELTEKKRVIDIHMNLAMFLLKTIKERSIDLYYELEQSPSKMVFYLIMIVEQKFSKQFL